MSSSQDHTGLSEFSETVIQNAEYIRENIDTFDVEAIQRFLAKAEGIVDSLKTVNQKDKSGNGKTFSNYICNMYSRRYYLLEVVRYFLVIFVTCIPIYIIYLVIYNITNTKNI